MLELLKLKRKKVENNEASVINPNLLLPTREFSKDMQALAFLIKHELDIGLYLLNAKLNNKDIIREDAIKIETNRISTKIVNNLASDYVELLMLYYTEEALIEFITQSVLTSLLKVAIVKNKATVQGNADGTLISRTDI